MMSNNAIFFPFIDVPPTPWLTRVLLYWDTLWAIVPMEYMHDPHRHSPFMRDLLAAELVSPCVPAGFVYDVNRVGGRFIGYVERSASRRRALRVPGSFDDVPSRIHIEKLGDWGDELVRLGVAQRADYPWYDVQPWVARAYMAFLASVIGMTPDVHAVPVTNDGASFRLLSGTRRRTAIRGYRDARDAVLPALFPLPTGPTGLDEIVTFKAKHSDKLKKLRDTVERECETLADIPDLAERDRAAAALSRKFASEVEDLADAMRSQWQHVVVGSILTALGAPSQLAGDFGSTSLRVSAGSALAAAVYGCFATAQDLRSKHRKPLAYAALATRRFAA